MADQLGTRAIHRLSGSRPNAYATKVVSSAEAQRQRVACEMGGERGDDGEEIAARRGNACERLAFVRLSRSTLICVQTLPEKIEHTSSGSLAQPCGALAGFHCYPHVVLSLENRGPRLMLCASSQRSRTLASAQCKTSQFFAILHILAAVLLTRWQRD